MREITQWFQRQSVRERRIVSLEEALLSHRFWAYALYRLRYFFALYGTTSVVHAVTVVLLYRIFFQREFIAILAVYAGASFLSNFWWGALEVMRSRVRLLYRSGKPRFIPAEITRWLGLSIQLALATAAGAIGWSLWRLFSGDGTLDPASAYVIALLFRLSLEFVIRCYHSGIYAIRRVYRPVWAIAAVDLVGLAAMLALWPWLSSWSFSAAATASTLTLAVLTIHYSRRAYRFFGFAPTQGLSVTTLRKPVEGATGELVGAGLSYAVMSMDSLLILTLMTTRGRGSHDPGLVGFFFLISPTIQAGFRWARLLYFDLKRLETKVLRNLLHRFEKALFRLAVLLGVVFWALATIIGALGYGGSLSPSYWLLLPFFIARSLLALVQIQAFAERRYRQLLTNGTFCLAGFLAVGLAADDPRVRVILLAVFSLAAFALLKTRQAQWQQEVRSREVLYPSEWLAQVRAMREPVRIAAARFFERPDGVGRRSVRQWEKDRRRLQQFGAQVAGRLKRDGAVTLFYPGVIAWYERANITVRLSQDWLIIHGAGLLEWLGDTGVQGNGRAGLNAACCRSLLGPDLHEESSRRIAAFDVADLKTAFTRAFPEGVIYDPDEPAPASLDALSAKEKSMILFDAVAFARDFRPSLRQSLLHVTAFCEAGELRLIFIVDRRTDVRMRAHWESLIKHLNLQAALNSTPRAANGTVPAGQHESSLVTSGLDY